VPVPFAIPVNIETTIPFVVSTEYVKSPEIPLNLDLDAKIKEKFPSMSINNLKSAKLSSFSVDLCLLQIIMPLNWIKLRMLSC
jgi:hypothetical protein